MGMVGTKGEGTSSVLNSHGGHSHLVTTSPSFEPRQTRSAIATAGQLTPRFIRFPQTPPGTRRKKSLFHSEEKPAPLTGRTVKSVAVKSRRPGPGRHSVSSCPTCSRVGLWVAPPASAPTSQVSAPPTFQPQARPLEPWSQGPPCQAESPRWHWGPS